MRTCSRPAPPRRWNRTRPTDEPTTKSDTVTNMDAAGLAVRRRAVLLSGSLGKGHDTLAEGCAASLGEFGFESTMYDSMALLGRGGSIGDWVFRRLFSISPVYDAFHFSQLRAGGRIAR